MNCSKISDGVDVVGLLVQDARRKNIKLPMCNSLYHIINTILTVVNI